MAFVSQSARRTDFNLNSQTGEVGPGAYQQDLNASLIQLHKVSNKKFPAFGQSEERKLNESQTTAKFTPGPGTYNWQKDLVNTAYNKDFDESIQYMINDNGHLNKRTQQYAFLSQQFKAQNNKDKSSPLGPGSYEVNTSSFQKAAQKSLSRKMFFSPTNLSNSQILNQSIPTIPSRYLMPNLDIEGELDSSQQDQSKDYLVTTKVKKLVEDKSKLGPGCYNVNENVIKKSPRGIQQWNANTTSRGEHFIKHQTSQSVGPGYYEKDIKPQLMKQSFNRSIINRTGSNTQGFKTFKKRRGGSIRDNYEETSSEDEKQIGPGPGEYLSETHVSAFARLKAKVKPLQYQFFGTSIERFEQQGFTNPLGPGQYNIDRDLDRQNRNKTFQVAGSSSFVGSKRDPQFLLKSNQTPGPGDYNSDKSFKFLLDSKLGKNATAFASRIERFKEEEAEIPGPGQYKVPGAFAKTSKNSGNANFKSKTKRALEFKIDTDIPGVGQYDGALYQSCFIDKISGGAPNNFLLLAGAQEHARKDKLPHATRFVTPVIQTPVAVGPGSYTNKRLSPEQQKILENKVMQQEQILGGKSKRFKNLSTDVPGPGQYSDLNTWHKKTYNLKFLNVQATPYTQGSPSSS